MKFLPRHVLAPVLPVALALLLVPLPSLAAPPARSGLAPEKMAAVKVQDLHYGDVLFHFWSDQDGGMETLVRIETYDKQQRLTHHEADAQLLSAALFLRLGMQNEAGARFEALTRQNLPVAITDKAWFYLAKIWYARGYDDQALAALGRIVGVLPEPLATEQTHLHVSVLMRQQKYDEVVQLLRGWTGSPDWMAYARFNLGVALIHTGKLDEAAPVLTSVGTMQAGDEEMASLKDRANLALGFGAIQGKNPELARTALERVRLDGPFSTRALLGDGWARADMKDFRSALTPWLTLRKRGMLDPAVQEAWLAVPYALIKLKSNEQAAQYYRDAVDAYIAQDQALDALAGRVGDGTMVQELLQPGLAAVPATEATPANAKGKGRNKEKAKVRLSKKAQAAEARRAYLATRGRDLDRPALTNSNWQLQQLPQTDASDYLYSLVADHAFQEGLRNYRDVGQLDQQLRARDEQIDAYEDYLATSQRTYAGYQPRLNDLASNDVVRKLQQQRDQLRARVTEVDTGHDVLATADAQQRDQWRRITILERALAGQRTGLEVMEAADKLRLLKGALSWQLETQFRQKLEQDRAQLREVDRALSGAQRHWTRLQGSGVAPQAPSATFNDRVADAAQRIKQLHDQAIAVRRAQSGFLTDLALEDLHSQQQRLEAYQAQANFALATILDQAGDAPQSTPPGSEAPDSSNAPGAPADPAAAPAPAPASDAPAPGTPDTVKP